MKTIYIILGLLLLVIVCYILSEMMGGPELSEQNINLSIQEKIRSCTGYDWSNFNKADKNAKPAALYLLSNELNVLQTIYDLVDRSYTTNKNLNLKVLDYTDHSKENILDVISGMNTVYNYFQNNDLPTQKYQNRLESIKNHIGNYGLAEGDIVSEECKEVLMNTLGLDAEDILIPKINTYEKLLENIVSSYNLFLIRYDLNQ